MKRNFTKSSLTLVLAFIMLLTALPLASVAEEASSVSQAQIVSVGLQESEVPDIISFDEALEFGHEERRYDLEEGLDDIVFENEDGTNTVYIYDFPVKYIDENEEMQDKSFEIAEEKGTFTSVDNDISSTFSKSITDGVILEHEDVDIKMTPLFTRKFFFVPKAKETDDNVVSYKLDSKVSLEYALTYMGIKEEIVLSEYPGFNEFDFLVETNGLEIYENELQQFYFRDSEGNVKANIGEVIIFTADERNNTFGSMKVETIEDFNQYKLTVVVDDEYLRSEDTAYPVRIDPTVEVSSASGIQDVTINSNSGSDGASGSLFVGKRATYGTSRTLMRFPGLNLSVAPSATYINKTTVIIRDLMCESTAMTVYCHTFTGNSWSESTANWSNVSPNSYVSTALSSKSISYANGSKLSPIHAYAFDITTAVKGWKNGTYSQAKGIIFKASSSIESGSANTNKTFGSSDRSSYKPVLKFDYKGAITASNLTIYQTLNRPGKDDKGNVPEDIKINTKTKAQLTSMKWITAINDFPSGIKVSTRQKDWELLCKMFTGAELRAVGYDMIARFMAGTGGTYTNSTLTTKAKEHPKTKALTNGIANELKSLLKTYNGNISKLKYTSDTTARGNNPLIQRMKNNSTFDLPAFNTDDDRNNGLTFCVNQVWAYDIVVKSYTCNGEKYEGELTFTFYDHFGLDTNDIDKFGYLAGFRQWYILQHFKDYGGAYKPFVTKMSFNVKISGSI